MPGEGGFLVRLVPRGLWLVNQLRDLLQLRSFRTENVARLHMRLS